MEDLQKLFDAEKYDEVLEKTEGSTDFDALSFSARAHASLGQFDSAINDYEIALGIKGDFAECIGLKCNLLEDIGKQLENQFSAILQDCFDHLTTAATNDSAILAAFRCVETAFLIPGQFGSIWERLCKPQVQIEDFMRLGSSAGFPSYYETIDHFAEAIVSYGERMIHRGVAIEAKQENGSVFLLVGNTVICKAIPLVELCNEKNENTRGLQSRRIIDALMMLIKANPFEGRVRPLYNYGSDPRKKLIPELSNAIRIMKSIDPSYIAPSIPPINDPNAVNQQSGGCYVATAVYGSYDCPEVWTLRRYRDNTLAETWYGRVFIRTYYAVSPTLVKWFGNTAWFKKLWKGKLDRMVKNLQAQGFEDSPYVDKLW